MKDFWYWYSVPVCAIGVATALCIFAAWVSDKERGAFMAECQQHEPHYKCTALWRAGAGDGAAFATGAAIGMAAARR